MERSKWNVVIHNLQNYSWTPTVTCKKVKQFPDSLVVYIRYCEQRSCGWGLRQPVRQSWAWWRPGWGWWRSDGWSAYGRIHETYKKRVESSKERDCLNSFSVYKYICHTEQLDWLMLLCVDMSDIRGSRICAAENEEGAAFGDGWNLFFDGEFRKSLRPRPRRDFWELVIVGTIITHWKILKQSFWYDPSMKILKACQIYMGAKVLF